MFGNIKVLRSPQDSFFTGAKNLLPAIEILNRPEYCGLEIPITFLSGQIAECLLKAFLSSRGKTEDELRNKPYGHNLINLWKDAVILGLPGTPSPPDWVNELHRLHCGSDVNKKFPIRYPMNLNGLVLPKMQQMILGLKLLYEDVDKEIYR